MKAERQQKEPQKADPIQSKRERSKLSFVDNRPQMTSQSKLINALQNNKTQNAYNNNIIQRQIKLFTPDTIYSLKEIDDLRKLVKGKIFFTEAEEVILKAMLESPVIYMFSLTEDLSKIIQDNSIVRLSFLPEAIDLFLQTIECQEVQHYEMLRGALPYIHQNGYFVESILEAGSTKPAVLKDFKSGKRKVLKIGGKSPEHILSEFLSCKLYETIGAPVIDTTLVPLGDRSGMLMDFIDNLEKFTLMDLKLSENFRRYVAMDFLLGNWDIVKTDNWIKKGGRYIRLDNGGSLIFRAQGEYKTEKEWGGEEICEINEKLPQNMIKSRSYETNPFYELDKDTIMVSVNYLLNSFFPGFMLNNTNSFIRYFYNVVRKNGLEPSGDFLIKISRILSSRMRKLAELSSTFMRYEVVYVKEIEKSNLPMLTMDEIDLSTDPIVQEIRRMKGGFLIRRLGQGELDSFKKAAQQKDIQQIKSLLFDSRPGGGEIVFSVNYPHRFRNESERSKFDYSITLEIPITDELIRYLAATANFSETFGSSKSNPVLKREGGESEHRGLDQADIPNVLIKKASIDFFWETIRQIRLISSDKHRTLRPEKDLIEERKRKEEEVFRERCKKKEEEDRQMRERALLEYQEMKSKKSKEEEEENLYYDIFK